MGSAGSDKGSRMELLPEEMVRLENFLLKREILTGRMASLAAEHAAFTRTIGDRLGVDMTDYHLDGDKLALNSEAKA